MSRGEKKKESAPPLAVKCPQCGTRAIYVGNPWRPFCSERCKLIDLGQWAEEKYSITGEDSAPLDNGEG